MQPASASGAVGAGNNDDRVSGIYVLPGPPPRRRAQCSSATEMRKVARCSSPGATIGRSMPLTSAFVWAVIGSKQMKLSSEGENTWA